MLFSQLPYFSLQVEPAASMAASTLSPPMSSLPPPPPLNHQGSPDCYQTSNMMGGNSADGNGTSGSSASMISTECSLCGDLITDRFILQVANRSWHANCLRCTVCHAILDGHTSCFLKDDLLYCKSDYTKYVLRIDIFDRSYCFKLLDIR